MKIISSAFGRPSSQEPPIPTIHNLRAYPNHIKGLEITRLNQVWADRSISTELTLNALRMAIKMRWNENLRGLIHHSDQGVQYASKEYIRCLTAHGIQISMSARGNPYDNAFVESFIRTLKYEEVYLNEYESFSEALENIAHFIEDIYNRKRLHSSLGYHPPIDFEKEVTLNSVA